MRETSVLQPKRNEEEERGTIPSDVHSDVVCCVVVCCGTVGSLAPTPDNCLGDFFLRPIMGLKDRVGQQQLPTLLPLSIPSEAR